MEPDDKLICKTCGQQLQDHFLSVASNGAAIASTWGKDGNSVIECFPDSVRADFPKCFCCDEPIFDKKASHESCTQTIIDERDYFQNINRVP